LEGSLILPSSRVKIVCHRITVLNVLAGALLHTISHDEAPERNLF
jgi:hypothetical protein